MTGADRYVTFLLDQGEVYVSAGEPQNIVQVMVGLGTVYYQDAQLYALLRGRVNTKLTVAGDRSVLYLPVYLFRHVEGLSSTSNGISSRRPISMIRASTSLLNHDRGAKLAMGPRAPSDGPTLLIQVSDATKDSVKPSTSSETTSVPAIRISRYAT